MNCPNHKEYPECPYLLKQHRRIKPKGGSFVDCEVGRICQSTLCIWRLEKQQEEILRLLRGTTTEEPLPCLDATSRHYQKRCSGFCERYAECTIKGRTDID